MTTVEANFANQPAMIEGGKVDMIELLPQFVARTDGRPANIEFCSPPIRCTGFRMAVFWGMRADVIAANRPALTDFFTDYMRAVRWFLNPANREEALAIAVAVTHAPAKNLDFAFTGKDFYRPPDLMPLSTRSSRKSTRT